MPIDPANSSVAIVNSCVQELLIPHGFKRRGRNKFVKEQSDDIIIQLEVLSYSNPMNSGLQINFIVTSTQLYKLHNPELAERKWSDSNYYFYPHIDIDIADYAEPRLEKFIFPRTIGDAEEIIHLIKPRITETMFRLLTIHNVNDILEYWKESRFLALNFL